MDVAALVLFASTLLVAAASPGPGIAALVAQVLGKGSHRAGAFAAGLILGDLVWLAVAILGLAAVAQTFHEDLPRHQICRGRLSPSILRTGCGRRRPRRAM